MKPRVDHGNLDMNKQFDWNRLVQKGDRVGHQQVQTHDSLLAATQLLKKTSSFKMSEGGARGPISLERQGPRKYTHLAKAEQSERDEKAIAMLNDESYAQRKKAMRKKDISNIHSRLTKRSKRTASPSPKEGKDKAAKDKDSNKTSNYDSMSNF